MLPWRPDPARLLFWLLLPGLLLTRPWLEAGMAWHMGVQLPLLLLSGVLLARLMHWRQHATALRRYRMTLLLFALFTLALWMLPRLLDAALHQPWVELLKFISLPLAGAALWSCWPHLPIVLRGVLHLEWIASLLRLGWLYLQSPERYCVSYDIGDQQSLGYLLLAYATAYGVLLAVRMLFFSLPVRHSQTSSL